MGKSSALRYCIVTTGRLPPYSFLPAALIKWPLPNRAVEKQSIGRSTSVQQQWPHGNANLVVPAELSEFRSVYGQLKVAKGEIATSYCILYTVIALCTAIVNNPL